MIIAGHIIGEENPEHTHAPNTDAIAIKRAVTKIKKTAAKSDEGISGIVTRVTSQLNDSVVANLPTTVNLLRTARRHRFINTERLPTPKDLPSLVIPDSFSRTMDGEQFLLYDSGGDERMLIFSTHRNLELLVKCREWAGDGTFKCVPIIYQQLYTIHAWFEERLIPLVYILTPFKTEEGYNNLFNVLKQCETRLNPISISIDFEMGMIKAFQKNFPNAKIVGCFFHYGQCLWRRVQASGSQKMYNDDLGFAKCIKKLIALAFVPVVDVIFAYEQLIRSVDFTQYEAQLSPILDYYESNWVGKLKRNVRRSSPKFSIKMWNCYDSVLGDKPRTNNNVEGWHSGFNKRINCSHLELGKFINVMKKEQSITENLIVQHSAGREINIPRRREYVINDERIKRIVTSYSVDDIQNYLNRLCLTVVF